MSVHSNEPPHDKTNKMACAPSEESDQPGHPPSLFRVFAVRMKKAWTLSYPLNGCPGWSESSLGAHATLLVLSLPLFAHWDGGTRKQLNCFSALVFIVVVVESQCTGCRRVLIFVGEYHMHVSLLTNEKKNKTKKTWVSRSIALP